MNVYKHYNQEQLNAQYNTRRQVPEFAMYFDRAERLSRETENENTVLKDIPFGVHEKECLDIYPSKIPQSKTLVFIHGGYWHLLDKSMFHFLAGHFLKYNVTTILINYPLAPLSTISEIVGSCSKAMEWIHENIKNFNGDPEELYLLGHSAGGHLASMMLVEEQVRLLRGVFSLSGIFRLEPVMLSYLNESIGMDHGNAMENSPVFLEPKMDCPFLLVTGDEESDEFKAQSEELFQCWKGKSSSIELLQVPHKNHYSILFAVVEKDSNLFLAMKRLMNI